MICEEVDSCFNAMLERIFLPYLNHLSWQGFSSDHMRPWKAHWDRQLYKALEHQYQMGLEALNENLPEIKVELTYR